MLVINRNKSLHPAVDKLQKMRAAFGIKLAHYVIKQKHRIFTGIIFHIFKLGKFSSQCRASLLPLLTEVFQQLAAAIKE